MKCWEGSGRRSSACGGRFRIKDLEGGVSKAVTARPKGANKVGYEGTGRDGCGVPRTGCLEERVGYGGKGNGLVGR